MRAKRSSPTSVYGGSSVSEIKGSVWRMRRAMAPSSYALARALLISALSILSHPRELFGHALVAIVCEELRVGPLGLQVVARVLLLSLLIHIIFMLLSYSYL